MKLFKKFSKYIKLKKRLHYLKKSKIHHHYTYDEWGEFMNKPTI